jgi:hypothetical protein
MISVATHTRRWSAAWGLALAAVVSGGLELHSEHGLGEPTASPRPVYAAGCRSTQDPHLDAAGPEVRPHCAACLHRLQVGGGHLAPGAIAFVAPPVLRRPTGSPVRARGALHCKSAPRGPPAL